jgi:hypothetical protein
MSVKWTGVAVGIRLNALNRLVLSIRADSARWQPDSENGLDQEVVSGRGPAIVAARPGRSVLCFADRRYSR